MNSGFYTELPPKGISCDKLYKALSELPEPSGPEWDKAYEVMSKRLADSIDADILKKVYGR